MNSNPFFALFAPVSNEGNNLEVHDTRQVCTVDSEETVESESDLDLKVKTAINSLIERTFFFTINEDRAASCQFYLVFLEEIANAVKPQSLLDIETLKLCLFERLLLTNPEKLLLKSKANNVELKELACEKLVVNYLFESYERLCDEEKTSENYASDIEKFKTLILENCCLMVVQPDLFENQNIGVQLEDLFFKAHSKEQFLCFIKELSEFIWKDTGDLDIISGIYAPLFHKILTTIKGTSYLLVDSNIEGIINVFLSSPLLGKIFVQANFPNDTKMGKGFMNTILGALLSVSCLPKSELDPYEFFEKPSSQPAQVHSAVEGNIWTGLSRLHDFLHTLFYSLFKLSPEVKHLLMYWICDCLEANSGRTKLWNAVSDIPLTNIYISDGFAINLSDVLSSLCQPFCTTVDGNKLCKIKYAYGRSQAKDKNDAMQRSIHLKTLSKDVFLIPGDLEDQGETFNFTTEIFFISHKAFDIGFRVVYEKFLKLNQELGKLQRLYNDARIQGGDMDDRAMFIKDMMDKGMTKYLSYKAALLEPKALSKCMKFNVSTCLWLKSLCNDSDQAKKLVYIPEFLAENVIDFLIFLRRFSLQTIENSGELLSHILMFIVTFMGSPTRMKNPHLRAKLAECLEAILPSSEISPHQSVPTYNRDRIFNSPDYVDHFVPSLLHVFVSIEMTGQSVAFEQKFNYRRPMYVIMSYLWKCEPHKCKFKQLAKEAEDNIDGIEPPLFLRFINLLINDAIFLLDEGLQYMSQLKNLQAQRDSGGWKSLSAQQRQELESNFTHTGMFARFHNTMGLETIKSLEMLTSEIKSIFCHASLVDRIASMLNYFLLNLVGPQKKNFKVKDLKEYDFQPGEVVYLICRIYLNLGDNSCFCSAVSRDGRSYKPELFSQANDVLVKIGRSMLIGEMEDLAKKVEGYAERQRSEDELANIAPEEFLDPIMSTVMVDPVKLPSSGVVVDRSTISRHLLSDQTDPFNRSPLTMDSVVPVNELRERISGWLKDMRK